MPIYQVLSVVVVLSQSLAVEGETSHESSVSYKTKFIFTLFTFNIAVLQLYPVSIILMVNSWQARGEQQGHQDNLDWLRSVRERGLFSN